MIRRPTQEMSDSCLSTPQLFDDQSQMSLLSITAASEASEVSDVEDVMNDLLSKITKHENTDTNDSGIVKQVLDGIIDKVCEQSEVDNSYTPVAASRSDHMYAKQPQSGTSTPTRSSKRNKRASLAAEFQHAEKRRSSRVKQTTKQSATIEKAEDHKTVLEKLIPRCLLEENTAEHGYNAVKHDAMDCSIDQIQESQTTVTAKPEARQIENQESEIKDFLSKTSDNRGVISLMREWMHSMVNKRDCKWSQELTNLYIKMFEINQESFERPNIFSDRNIEAYAMLTLLWLEMKVETLTSPAGHSSAEDKLFGALGRNFRKELTYWDMILGSRTKLPSYYREYTLRFYWMAAKYYSASSDPVKAIHAYSNLAEFIKSEEEPEGAPTITLSLTNSSMNDIISLKTVTEQLDSIARTQTLEELHTFYAAKEYKKVVELLAPTFSLPMKKRLTESRYSQLNILLATIPELGNPDNNAVEMLEEVLHESLCHLKQEDEKWNDVIGQCFSLISSFIEKCDCSGLSHTNIVRLSRNCLTLIDKFTKQSKPSNHKKDDSETPPTVQTIMPWIILSQLMIQYERRGNDCETSTAAEEPLQLPASCR